jgi:hypothetical protein
VYLINTELLVPNVPVELVPLLFHIREVAGSSILETIFTGFLLWFFATALGG